MSQARPTWHRAGWATLGAAIFLALAVMSACSATSSPAGDDSPRPLTGSQAERLALSRFNAYQDGVRVVSGTVIGDQAVTINGWLDTAQGRGYAIVRAPDALRPGAFLTKWTASQVSAQDFAGSTAPLPPPETGWQTATLDPTESTLAAAQALLLSLSSDRPDNAQLLAQSGAQWLGSGTVDGIAVDIMSGPVAADSAGGQSSFRYWVDDSGNLLRLQVLLDGIHLSTFDFSAAPEGSF